jgi:carboxyl-terminal processing protease
MAIQSVFSSDNNYRQLKKLEEAFSIITKKYVEDVDSSKLVRDAIEGMIEGLDPHSVYIDSDRMQSVRENFDGSFEGIGISYEWTEGEDDRDTVTVIVPLSGGPSEEAGLLPGDRIIKVDGRDAVGFTRSDVNANLKGPKGTKVHVTVKRPNYHKLLEFEIIRDKIPLWTVDASYMMDEETGYIKLNRFARTTHSEMRDALTELKADGLTRLIFDLRGNSGGYMEMAVKVADEFLPDHARIVYTKSRHTEFTSEFSATERGVFETGPVILLVDENSASASEIVAGALQDHDRGLIVGRRTFGKGLVQRQYPLTDGSVLQMTTSKYYTPAGRLIQTPYANGHREEYYKKHSDRFETLATVDAAKFMAEAPDSLRFETVGGREVFGGGGIVPDFVVARTADSVLQAVIGGGLDYRFARLWLGKNPQFRVKWNERQDEFNERFQIDDVILDEFWNFAAEHGVSRVADSEIEALRAAAADSILYFAESEVGESQEALETRIKAYMARRIWGVSAWYPVVHDIDTAVIEASKLWDSANDLAYMTRRQE